jgi:hypothetical protein
MKLLKHWWNNKHFSSVSRSITRITIMPFMVGLFYKWNAVLWVLTHFFWGISSQNVSTSLSLRLGVSIMILLSLNLCIFIFNHSFMTPHLHFLQTFAVTLLFSVLYSHIRAWSNNVLMAFPYFHAYFICVSVSWLLFWLNITLTGLFCGQYSSRLFHRCSSWFLCSKISPSFSFDKLGKII